jgi:hypothetical protein
MSIKETAETEIILSGGDKAGKTINELTAQSVKLNREIKKMEVGSDEFVKATADYQKINGRLKEVRTQVNGVTKAQTSLNKELAEFVPFNSQIQKFMGSYKGISSAIKGTTMAQKLLNAAFIASGIGALVVLFGSLISYLTTTQEGMDKLRRVTLPLFQVFERLKGLLQTFGQGLFQLASGDVLGGLKTLKDSVTGIGDAFTEGIAAGRELADLTEEIERKENDLVITRQKLNREFEEFKALSADARLSEAERQKAATQAIDALERQKTAERELLDLQIRKRELEASANDTSRADQREINELIAQRETLEANFARQKAELTGVLAGTEKAVTDTIKKETAEREKVEAEYQKKVAKAAQDLETLRISLIEDTTERTIAQINQRFERELAAFEGSEDQKTQFLLLKEQERTKALDDLRTANMLKSFEQEEADRRTQVEESFYNFLITEKEREDMLFELKRSEAQRRLDLIEETQGAESEAYRMQALEIAKIDKSLFDKRIQDAQDFATAKRNLDQMGLQSVQDVVSSTLGLLSTEEEGRRKNVNAIKAFKAMQMKISFFTELQAIWENANASPTNILFPGSGNIIAGLKSAAAGARYIAGIREVMGAKYAQGGPVFGPSHASGGIPFRVKGSPVRHEMEGNEIIMTKGVYENPTLRAAASMINSMAGGRSFALGGPVNPLNNRISPNENQTSIINNITNNETRQETEALVTEFRAFREEISSWQREMQVTVSLQKVKNGLDTLKEVETDAGI